MTNSADRTGSPAAAAASRPDAALLPESFRLAEVPDAVQQHLAS